MNPIINNPELWLAAFPRPSDDGHKYDRGHVQIAGSQALTGATRLAAIAAARIGAGLVTVIGGKKSDIYRIALPPHILVKDRIDYDQDKITASLVGPGGHPAKADIKRRFPTRHALILDADEIGAGRFPVDDYCVLTPHEGEFAKAFPYMTGTREERAVAAALKTGTTVVLKGAQTVIAAPDGQVVVNTHASPYLATAGSGDVLAGMIAGLSAQAMHPFIASCAAVWIHGEASRWIGPGLVASDLPDLLPGVLARLLNP